MTKTHTVETVEEFDENGKLLKRTVTETDETDDNPVRYTSTVSPYIPPYTVTSGYIASADLDGRS